MLRPTLTTASIALALMGPFATVVSAQQGRNDATFNWSKELAAGSRVTIRNGNGRITVRESRTNRVEVSASKILHGRSALSDVAFDSHESDGGVEICTLYDGQSSCGDRTRNIRGTNIVVEYTVLVPPSMQVHVATGNGDVLIERGGADIVATTGNGRIDIGKTDGRIDATTGNGPVTIESANGPVKVTTGNGRISINAAQGAVSATTGSGEIDVRITTLTTDSDMSFNSGSGSVRVTLPANFNGRVDASSGNGSLRSDFEISVIGRLDSHHVRGTIGKGGALLRLNTGNGTIELRKN